MRLSDCPAGVYVVAACRSETLSAFGLYEGARIAVARPCKGALPAIIFARGAKAAVGRALADAVTVRAAAGRTRYYRAENGNRRASE